MGLSVFYHNSNIKMVGYTRLPSLSGTSLTAPSMASSKLGHPEPESNLSVELKRGVLHFLLFTFALSYS